MGGRALGQCGADSGLGSEGSRPGPQPSRIDWNKRRALAQDVSELLVRWQAGDNAALEQLMPLVYSELRTLGRAHLRRRPEQSILQPTILVHEAWLKLVRKQRVDLRCRTQFYSLAARIMRDVLVDYHRRRQASKRGGSRIEVAMEDANPGQATSPLDFLVLDDAIRRLGNIKARYTQIIELRFFGGLSIEEAAEAMQVSHATIEREWNFARSWLRRELAENRQGAR